MLSPDALDEIQRIQNEFGACKLQIPDPVEAWWYDVTEIHFDPETQSIRLVSGA